MKMNKRMKLLTEHKFLEILKRIFGVWGGCIKNPGEVVVSFWGLLPDKILAMLLTPPVAVCTAIIASKC